MSETRPGFDHESETSPEKEANVAPIEKQPKQSGWQEETDSREQSFIAFIAAHYGTRIEDRKEYNISEFHISGGGDVNFRDLTGQVVKIQGFYQNGELTKIHAVLRADKKFGTTDIYLSGEALAEYLGTAE